jgi:hypothetical protein
MHTYYDQFGSPVRLQFTGKVTIEYSDLITGATYRPNSSGPGELDLLTGALTLRGGNPLFDANGMLIASDGRVILDPDGNIISLTGHVTDVCQQLGSAPL